MVMNSISMIGHLATSPELKEIPGGRKVCRFRLAVKGYGKNAEADFFTVICWDKQAENVAKFTGKGRMVSVEGRLSQNTWEKDGKKNERVEIVANRVGFLGGGNTERQEEANTTNLSDDDFLEF